MKLNKQQEKAANHFNGPCLVTAVPGSGKTAMLVERTYRLVDKGVPLGKIMCLTFTNKAANEMKERIKARLSCSNLRMFVGTFHSLCVRIIRKHHVACGLPSSFTILDSSDQESLIKRVARQEGYDLKKRQIVPEIIARSINSNREELGDDKNLEKIFLKNELPQKYLKINVDIANKYLETLKTNGSVDFSGLLHTVYTLFKENDHALSFIQNTHDYLQVDEVQDTNLAQFELINMISKRHRNVFMVGDLSQSIYGWRGSRCQNIKDFIALNRDCVILELGLNYRSTPEIIKVADTLIRHNVSHMGSEFKTENPSGRPVFVKKCLTVEDESEFVSSLVLKSFNSNLKPHEIAILYRLNSQSRSLEEAFRRKKIPYKVVGGFGFYERSEIKDCIAMLRLVANKDDIVAFDRVCSFVGGVGTVAELKVEEIVKNNPEIGLIAACELASEKLPKNSKNGLKTINKVFTAASFKMGDSFSCLELILKELMYINKLRRSSQKKKEEKEQNVYELLSSLKNSNQISVPEFLHQVSLMSSSDEEEEQGRVTLMSLHASKGLEFPFVFMVGVEDGLLPHVRAVQERSDGLEEERRLCYVGMTRAKKTLVLTYCDSRSSYGKGATKCYPSQFLIESGLVQSQE